MKRNCDTGCPCVGINLTVLHNMYVLGRLVVEVHVAVKWGNTLPSNVLFVTAIISALIDVLKAGGSCETMIIAIHTLATCKTDARAMKA
jgi:hypothetical protein